MKQKLKQGVTLIFSIIITIVVSVLVLSIVQIVSTNSKNMVYFNEMQRCHRLAESGLNRTIGVLALDPKAYLDPNFSTTWHKLSEEKGWYVSEVSPAVFNGVSGYYIITSAVQNRKGKKFSSRLHTYARISNVADYFAAVNDSLSISYPVDIGQGMVYSAKDLTFSGAVPAPSDEPSPEPDPSPSDPTGPIAQTNVLRAEFVRFLEPPLDWDNWTKERIVIADTDKNGLHQPIKLDYEHLFPQISQQELEFYKSLAHVGESNAHLKCDFTKGQDLGSNSVVDIYPPGYTGGKFGDDTNTNHTDDNRDHVYYCNGNMNIEGRVHGQVLFVAEGNISINDSLCSAGDGECDLAYGPGETHLPGEGDPGASTAHQAILITKGSVIINNTFRAPVESEPALVSTEYIQALVMAPNGSFFPNEYDITTHRYLALNFKGSMILGTMNSAVAFPDVFGGNNPAPGNTTPRKYAYMTSLKSNPPPFMPRIADIYHSVEEVVDIAAPDPLDEPSPQP